MVASAAGLVGLLGNYWNSLGGCFLTIPCALPPVRECYRTQALHGFMWVIPALQILSHHQARVKHSTIKSLVGKTL